MKLTELELHIKTPSGKKLRIPVFLPENYRVGLLAEIKASTVEALVPEGNTVEAAVVDDDEEDDEDGEY